MARWPRGIGRVDAGGPAVTLLIAGRGPDRRPDPDESRDRVLASQPAGAALGPVAPAGRSPADLLVTFARALTPEQRSTLLDASELDHRFRLTLTRAAGAPLRPPQPLRPENGNDQRIVGEARMEADRILAKARHQARTTLEEADRLAQEVRVAAEVVRRDAATAVLQVVTEAQGMLTEARQIRDDVSRRAPAIIAGTRVRPRPRSWRRPISAALLATATPASPIARLAPPVPVNAKPPRRRRAVRNATIRFRNWRAAHISARGRRDLP
ncbi:MAG: hypothetical protein M3Y36_05085 [Actinomycetota bacterium]|nr:hypothetical protein [Actinomycetota bacterium]